MNNIKKVKYIFLDIDGVLNNEGTWRSREWFDSPYKENSIAIISEENLAAFEWMIKELEQKYTIKIVLSSTWRRTKGGVKMLSRLSQKHKCLKFDGYTGEYLDKRGMEIQAFLDELNINSQDILIIDDGSDMLHLSNRLLQTYVRDGLTFKDAERGIEMINKQL